ncbi:MAG: hypothetical protein M3N37_09470 [Actinomycetota bacterium]|nr:hypothetical protein [Actinomycetota bacterium]MDP8955121.1 hypothetical protein [Actinomycetota bacterium]
MPTTLVLPSTDSLHVKPWPDPVIDRVGHDPRSAYVEQFWLGILGPSTTWLLRRVAAKLEAAPAGFDLPLADTARALGIGGGGSSSPFVRALGRCCQFQLAAAEDDGVLVVRRKLPPLNRRQLARLPEPVQTEHQRWQDSDLATAPVEKLRRRSRCLALSLLELGEDLEATERQLLRWRFHPALCHESAAWAWERHSRALAEAMGADASCAPAGSGPAAA